MAFLIRVKSTKLGQCGERVQLNIHDKYILCHAFALGSAPIVFPLRPRATQLNYNTASDKLQNQFLIHNTIFLFLILLSSVD